MKQKIIVVGAGFAGLQFVRKIDPQFFDILIIDKLNHHQFQPLFYQVATSQIEPSSISFPIRHIFKNKNHVRIRMGELLRLNHQEKSISTNIGDFEYDYLVIATGCKTNYFGNREIEKNAFSLKSTYDSITIRNHILQTFESVLAVPEEKRGDLLQLVIVGAGPTGVELAGAFAEIKRNILPKDYPRIDFSAFKIILIEGSGRTLNNMSENAKQTSRKYLENMGVTILTETFVENYDGEILTLKGGPTIKTETVIWAAGVIGNNIEGIPENEIKRGNRIAVNRTNQTFFSDNVFALGDIAYMETPNYPFGHPQVANVAINQAVNLAKNLNRIKKGKPQKEFEYKDLGSMATIGRNKAVVDFPFVRFKGYFAWVIWMFLHLMLILSVRNKLIVFINWAFAYITKDTSLRLILTPTTKK
jgi:NADH dehydrogenase